MKLTVPERNQGNIACKALYTNSCTGALILGMTHKEAVGIIQRLTSKHVEPCPECMPGELDQFMSVLDDISEIGYIPYKKNERRNTPGYIQGLYYIQGNSTYKGKW